MFFTKTHKRHKGDSCRAIYLVRDGRDTVVSQARLQASQQQSAGGEDRKSFESCLREAITRPFVAGQPSSGTWRGNVLSWLSVVDTPIVMLRYEELIRDPRGSFTRIVASLLPEMVPRSDVDIPSFHELRDLDGLFFRRGVSLSYLDEMPQELNELFWAQPGNALAMQRLGYYK